jgi:hypothetical protein
MRVDLEKDLDPGRDQRVAVLATVKNNCGGANAPSMTATARGDEDFTQAGTEGCYRPNKRMGSRLS